MIELVSAGFRVVIVDNLSNSSTKAIAAIESILGKPVPFHKVDVLDGGALDAVFGQHKIWAVIHFAGLKAVGESVEKPLEYYKNNVQGTISLMEAMRRADVKNIVFSSSATVYGFAPVIPIPETSPTVTTSPYGSSKLFVEHIIRDYCKSDRSWNAATLRYFNPGGAHPSGAVGEDPRGIPNNLLPYLAKVAVGQLPHLNVFGNDYPTRDGTGIRDYIHVIDLAHGHIAALKKLGRDNPGCVTYNLGTGKGSTVLEMVTAMSKAVGRDLPYQIVGRRAGDVTDLTADPQKANRELDWKAERTLDDICRDLWNWQSKHPNGYHIV